MAADRKIDPLSAESGLEPSSELGERVRALFRESFFEIRRAHKAAYVKQVVKNHYLSQRELGGLLGYSPKSGGAITGAKDGKIGDDKFDLLRATIARQIQTLPQWPPLSEFTTLALLHTITLLRNEGRQRQDHRTISREEFECLERVLRAEWRVILDGAEGKTAWPALLREVHQAAGTQQLQTREDVARTITEWASWYLLCKQAIPGLET